jgi:MFS family permease
MRVLNVANASSLVVGVLTLGLSSYVPLFSQRVLGTGALVAGLALAAMTIGWPIAAATAGRLYLSIGFRATLLIGATIATAGALLLLTVDGQSSIYRLAAACFVMGVGMGYVASPSVVAAQTAVTWSSRGVATGANMFARSVGSAVGVAIFGAIANAVIAARGGDASRAAVQAGSTAVFLAVLVAAVVSIAAGLLMPHTRAEDVSHGGTGESTPEDADLDLAEPSTRSTTA